MRSPRCYYGWTIVATSFLTLGLAFGVWYTFSVFFVAIIRDFGWDRATTSGIFSTFLVCHYLGAFAAGTLIDRWSPRLVIPAGALWLAVCLLLVSGARSMGDFYLRYGVGAAIGVSFMGFVPHATLLPRWFVRRRGLAVGIAMAGIGVGMLILPPTIQHIIDTAGWVPAYRFLALVILLAIPVNLLWQRRDPRSLGLEPDGINRESAVMAARPASDGEPLTVTTASSSAAGNSPAAGNGFVANAGAVPGNNLVAKGSSATENNPPPGCSSAPSPPAAAPPEWTIGTALANRRFWFLAAGFFLGPFAIQGTLLHAVACLVDNGLSPARAAAVFGTLGICGSVGKITLGHLGDSWTREAANTTGMAAASVGIAALMGVGSRPQLLPILPWCFAAGFGLGYGAAAPMFPSIAADIFHGPSFGRIFGLLSLFLGFGGAAGAWFTGLMHDITGSYRPAMILLTAALWLTCLAFWLAAPRHFRRT
ncbi:MAG: MFS transporter [Deltaproteobacteria bacterium]|nr:MFS transporter [Candidatus Anaeroferrophillacea bacterium]